MAKASLYKQCLLKQVGRDENCDTPWETVNLIELSELNKILHLGFNEMAPIVAVTQWKKTRNFRIIKIYPQIIKSGILNKAKTEDK
jgi:hypothetical protein